MNIFPIHQDIQSILVMCRDCSQQTHSVTGTLKPIAMITEANSIKSQIKG